MVIPTHASEDVAATTEGRVPLNVAVNLALHKAMQEDERVMVFGEDVGGRGGVFSVTAGLQKIFGEKRCFDTPLSENLLGGMAVGLAASGKKPVVEFQFADFSMPAWSQVYNHMAKWRTRTQGQQECAVVLRMPIGGGGGSPELHSGSPEALYAHIPGLRVIVPSSPSKAYGLLLAAIRDPDPVVFLEPIALYNDTTAAEKVVDDGTALPLDRAFVERDGEDVTLIAYGAWVRVASAVADMLELERGAYAEVIDAASIRYLDVETIGCSVHKTGRCVVIHEAPRIGGYAETIATALIEEGIPLSRLNFRRVCGRDTVYPLAALEGHYLPNKGRIFRAACELL